MTNLCPLIGFLQAEQTGRALIACPLGCLSVWSGTAKKEKQCNTLFCEKCVV